MCTRPLRAGVTILLWRPVADQARDRGRQIFLDNSRGDLGSFGELLAEFAPRAHNARVTAIEERFRAPLGVAVLGRRGVGRGAVTAALAEAGVTVLTSDAASAEVRVVVIAETLKPEERTQSQAVSGASGSAATMVVLNKADLTGMTPGGPLAWAERRAAEFATTLGVPVVPMIAPLATVGLDDEDVSALRTLVATAADMTSTDAFVGCDHPLPKELRQRLLERLDRFGLAHAVIAVADGATGVDVARQLRSLSQLERVAETLNAVAAPTRYRRVCVALHELRTLAAQCGDDRIDEFLTSDEVVIAVMAAAVDVVEAAGMAVERGDDRSAQLRRAVHFRRYARGPVNTTHYRCAADISRGSLRLLGLMR